MTTPDFILKLREKAGRDLLWLVGVTSTGLAALVFHWPLEWVYACTFLEEAVKMAVGIPHFKKKQWMNVLTEQPQG